MAGGVEVWMISSRMSMAVVVEVSVIIFVSVVNSVRFITAKLEG
jgi:hypothetical protein